MYISISYFAGILVGLVRFFLGGYDVMNSCMLTCAVSHLIVLEVGTIVQTMLSYGIWRIPLLSCRWSLGLLLRVAVLTTVKDPDNDIVQSCG
jgi:hypothetical protein